MCTGDESKGYRPHQLHNFVRLCELLVARGVSAITLVTGSDEGTAADQRSGLTELQASLRARGAALEWRVDSTLHDRQLQCSNGWVLRLGRGIDWFKRAPGQFVLGAHDMDMRPCFACNIDVWRET